MHFDLRAPGAVAAEVSRLQKLGRQWSTAIPAIRRCDTYRAMSSAWNPTPDTSTDPAPLYVSIKTVEFHLGHIFNKLGIRSRQDLITPRGSSGRLARTNLGSN